MNMMASFTFHLHVNPLESIELTIHYFKFSEDILYGMTWNDIQVSK